MEAVLEDMIASGLVHYSYISHPAELGLPPPTPGRSYNWQRPIYARCLERHGLQHRWMGFFDADEYVIMTSGDSISGSAASSGRGASSTTSTSTSGGSEATSSSGKSQAEPGLPALLRQYEQHGGLGLHWQQFGYDGHVERPCGGVLASYTACCPRHACPAHRLIKSLVQPQYTLAPQTVHSFVYRKGYGAVNTAGAPLSKPKVGRRQPVSRCLAEGC